MWEKKKKSLVVVMDFKRVMGGGIGVVVVVVDFTSVWIFVSQT